MGGGPLVVGLGLAHFCFCCVGFEYVPTAYDDPLCAKSCGQGTECQCFWRAFVCEWNDGECLGLKIASRGSL